ncbi:MAG: hypothetical protein EOM68_00635 [Spirochaetia bacterium]|nr:hypothetical protein [Spirochaetia bacterium]
MDYKTFLVKKVMMSFFVSVTCITVAMAVVGMAFEPTARFGYDAFLSPLIFGALATLPMLVKYSKKELSIKQTMVRGVIHLLLLEAVLLTSLYLLGLLSSLSLAATLAAAILVIDVTVNLVLWIQDTRTAKEFNGALQKMQRDHKSEEY